MSRKQKQPDSVQAQPEQVTIVIQPDMLPITLEEYARRTNQTYQAVKAQSHEKKIPTIQAGKGCTVYVNQAQLILSSLEAAGWNVQVPKGIYETVKREAKRYAA
ncbi:hypothetical protein [Enterovibrio nigricans]|uniref:Uncharacterized protein n=1 Tax=Enterovibrio nigricans DSM 22720 TaxID=1121868 RepID=A0A1T4W0J0_9GAMM|nr:hypothetical protein [Enterovibrio nigricans]PKF49163.1 hypothetical protein AT251_20955 [Enterovibrio nigricans]SKA70241.1 hypothetical protein SAMN02745132_04558 [Enterovibrio nigricans DSM 22720]